MKGHQKKEYIVRSRFIRFLLIACCFGGFSPLHAQTAVSLDNAIAIAQRNSYDAQLARFSFLSSYWTYKSFRAELLPSMSLTGGIMNFNHSRVEASRLAPWEEPCRCSLTFTDWISLIIR